MSGPKHLWSGDWELESAAAKRPGRAEPAPAEVDPRETTPADGRPPAQRRSPVTALLIAAAVLLIAGAAFGLHALLDGGDSGTRSTSLASRGPAPTTGTPPTSTGIPRATTPAPPSPQGIPGPQPLAPQQVPPQSNPPQTTQPSQPAPYEGPVVYWDGMQIETTSPGVVVITTVSLGSAGDRARLEPGDRLIAVNGHDLSSATDIAAAVKGLAPGRQIVIQVASASAAPVSVPITLGAPPRRQP